MSSFAQCIESDARADLMFWRSQCQKLNNSCAFLSHFMLRWFTNLYISKTFFRILVLKQTKFTWKSDVSALDQLTSMATLFCHINQSTWAMAIKQRFGRGYCYKQFYNVLALSPILILRVYFLIFFCRFNNPVTIATNQLYSRNISIKHLSKYLQWDTNTRQLLFFPL